MSFRDREQCQNDMKIQLETVDDILIEKNDHTDPHALFKKIKTIDIDYFVNIYSFCNDEKRVHHMVKNLMSDYTHTDIIKYVKKYNVTCGINQCLRDSVVNHLVERILNYKK